MGSLTLQFLFWFSLALLGFVYVGYPLVLRIKPRCKTNRVAPVALPLPSVTLIISAHNEREVIENKLENALNSSYPADLLRIVVVSDASDDGTDKIVDSYPSGRVSLLRMNVRSGKSLGLNEAVRNCDSEILIFTDANAMFESSAVSTMMAHFSDPMIGAVTGQQRYKKNNSNEQTQEGLYWRYESTIKQQESLGGSLVGGDGAIMAIRSTLYEELTEDDLSDYIIPLGISMRGFRNIYEPKAICVEEAAESYGKEFRRKVRIVNRAWRATMKLKRVLNPLRYGWLSFCVWSHKVLRWLAGVFMLVALVSNYTILGLSTLYLVTFIFQMLIYTLVIIGHLFRGRTLPAIIGVPYYFVLVNYAALLGIFEHYTGKQYVTWSTPRQNDVTNG